MNNHFSCMLCGGSSFRTLFEVRKHNIVSCLSCGLTMTQDFSPPVYSQYHRDKEYEESKALFENFFLKRIQILEEFRQKTGRVLEIGSSTGIFLKLLKDRGWEVTGVEPSESAFVARKKGIKVTRSFVEKARLPKDYFDVVILNHTLEHLENPLTALTKAREVLKRGGLLLIDVPNFGGISSRVLGKNWPYLMPEEHICHFTPSTLKKLIRKAGFKIVYLETRSGIFDWGNPVGGLYFKLANFRKSFFLDFFSMPMAYLSTKTGMGSTLTVVGKK